MLSFIKVFFQGILYVLLSPFLLIILIINLIYAILIYILYEVKSIFLFFQGINYESDDEETRKLKEIKQEMRTGTVINQPIPTPAVNNVTNSEVNNND